MILIEDNTNVDLNILAVNHYTTLTSARNKDDSDFHTTKSLIGRIKAQKIIDSAALDTNRVLFWDYLLNLNEEKLKLIITSRPIALKSLITEITNLVPANFFSIETDYNTAELTDFGKIVRDIFDYEGYRNSSESKTNAEHFNIKFCPYCNEHSVPVILRTNNLNGEQKIAALYQLDHFYPKSRHPYLSVSFFNLIPGCSSCNATLKREKKFDIDTHFNPFHKRLDDYFEFEITDLLAIRSSDVDIVYRIKQAHSDLQLKDFEIIERYNRTYKSVPLAIKSAFKNRSSRYRQSVIQQIKNLFPVNNDGVERLYESCGIPASRNNINDFHLGKLKRDIAIQMGVLNNP